MSNKSHGTYYIKTFGCAMNQSDSERIATFLESRGFALSENMDDAQLIIINTCGIRQAAENRVYSLVNNILKNREAQSVKCEAKNLKPRTSHLKPKIVVTGCIAHRKDVQRRLKDKVDLFFQISNFKEFENFIIGNSFDIRNSTFEIPARKKNTPTNENISYLSISPKYENTYQAFVPIMTGCNNFCSYCVVPYARGREVSRPADEIITEIKELIAKGYKHIVLLGQNVNSYKGVISNSKLEKRMNRENPNCKLPITNYVNFSQLLKKINNIPGKFWITFVSSHPKDMSNELIETIARCKKVCEYIHLPVQAGNDEVLKRMNRRYTQAHYLKVIRRIRKEFAQIRGKLTPISVSTDIIVGFPGETRAQFADSADIMEKAKYDMVYFCQFSPRPGTVAWNMKDNVSQKEKARREKILNEILKKTALANNKKYLNKEVEVLIEKNENDFYLGKTRTMKNIKIATNKKIPMGSFIKAKVTKANVWNLEGELK